MDPDQQLTTPPVDNSLADKLSRWWQSLNGPMRAIAIFAIATGLLLLAGALYVSLNPTPEQSAEIRETTTEPTQITAEVSITKNGLNPATITIDAGTQLTWTNNDDKPHQISADPHPKHDSIEG
jgi:plastocyanin